MSVAEGDAHVTERTEGETARHERRRGGNAAPRFPDGIFSPARSCGSGGRGVPCAWPRETLFAAGEGKGDGFGAESVALAGFRGSGGRGVPAARVVSS